MKSKLKNIKIERKPDASKLINKNDTSPVGPQKDISKLRLPLEKKLFKSQFWIKEVCDAMGSLYELEIVIAVRGFILLSMSHCWLGNILRNASKM